MRAISLWQPWASLWLTPSKIHETRHWPTPYRGLLAVHAAKRPIGEVSEELDTICFHQFGSQWRRALPRGALIGQVNLISCIETGSLFYEEVPPADRCDDFYCGDFAPGRFAWLRKDPLKLARPVPFTGRQGFFNVPDEVLRG